MSYHKKKIITKLMDKAMERPVFFDPNPRFDKPGVMVKEFIEKLPEEDRDILKTLTAKDLQDRFI